MDVAWNLKGAPSLHEYLQLDRFERQVIHRRLDELIERHNAQFAD